MIDKIIKCLLFLLGYLANLAVYAGDVKIQGRILDEHKNPMPAVTIQCYDEKDSFLTGITTADNGRFIMKTNSDVSIFQIIISYIGYQTDSIRIQTSADVDLGDILLKPTELRLEEVIVSANQNVRKENKLMIFPSKSQKRHAYDGYSALSAMMIPRLDVDPFSQTVKTRQGNTLLCINGREVGTDEIKALDPQDIIRVDFYEGYHPEHPTASSVIDYILRLHDYGSTMVGNLTQNIDCARTNVGVSAKAYHKKSEFSLHVNGIFNHYTPKNMEKSHVSFGFPNGVVTRTMQSLPSYVHKNAWNSTLSYLFQNENNQLFASMKIGNDNDKTNQSYTALYSNSSKKESVKENMATDDGMSAFQINYNVRLKHQQILRVKILGSYNKNSYDRLYQSWDCSASGDSISSNTSESFYYFNPSLLYTKAFKRHTLFLETIYSFKKTSNDYHYEGDIINSKLRNDLALVTVGYNTRVKDLLSFTLQCSDRYVYTVSGENSFSKHYFAPSFFLTLYLPKDQTINIQANTGTYDPEMRYQNEIEQQIDRYQVMRGNPFLKTSTTWDTSLTYTKGFRWGELSYFFKYLRDGKKVYEQVDYDADNQLFVHHYLNGGNSTSVVFDLEGQFKLIPDRLKWTLALEYAKQIENNWEKKRVENFIVQSKLLFTYKRIMSMAEFTTPISYVSRGSIYTIPTSFKFSTGYSWKQWHLNAGVQNPFNHSSKAEYTNENFSRVVWTRSPGVKDRVFYVNVNYRFNTGKKHQFKDIEMENGKNSSILRVNDVLNGK